MKLLYFFVFASLTLAVPAQEVMNELLERMGLRGFNFCLTQKVSNDEYKKCELAYDGLIRNITSYKSPLDSIIKGFCKNKTVLCGDVLRKKAYNCFNETQKRFLLYHNAEEHAGLKADCKDNEKLIRDLYKMNFDSCPSTIKKDISQCDTQKKTLLIGIKLRDYYTRNNCLKYFKIRDCYAGVYKYCTDNSFYKFITKTTKARFLATPCKASISELSSLLAIMFAFLQIQKLLF